MVLDDLRRLAEKQDMLGDSVHEAMLSLWRLCSDNPGWRERTSHIHNHLDKALKLVQQCSKDLETIISQEEQE